MIHDLEVIRQNRRGFLAIIPNRIVDDKELSSMFRFLVVVFGRRLHVAFA